MNKKLISGLMFAGGLLCGCTDHVTELDEAYELNGVKIKDFVFKDSRDGNQYSVAVIGGNVWMAENLRYADSSKSKNLKGNTWCYEDKEENCDKYGRLYSWTAALNLDSSSLTSNSGYGCINCNERGVCPEGWHIPSRNDWVNLRDYVDVHNAKESVARSLKSKTGWKSVDSVSTGVDRFGFNAAPSGRHNNDGDYMDAEKFLFFWSSVESDAGTAVGWTLRYDNEYLDYGEYYKNHGLSIRCVIDTNRVVFDTTKSFVAPGKIPLDFGYDSIKVEDKYYHTVDIDDLTWIAENMSVEKGDSWCYKDNADSCAKYGRLYSWNTAMDLCPEGWRLPTTDDFYRLYNFAGGANALRSMDNWAKEQGDDIFGFSALPAGGYDGDGFFDLHSSAYFWSSKENSKIEGEAYALFLNYYNNSGEGQPARKSNGYSVRCVKDSKSAE